MPTQVELDVYSGRPNPVWHLTPQEAEELLGQFRALPKSEVPGVLKQDLGYRGLIVKAPGAGIAGFDELVIGNRVVVARGIGRSQQFADAGRALERWLFQTSKGRVEDDLYAFVLAEIEKP